VGREESNGFRRGAPALRDEPVRRRDHLRHGSVEVLRQNLGIARGFTPMTDGEMDALRTRCAPTAADGRYEPY